MTQAPAPSLWREIREIGLTLLLAVLIATAFRIVAYQPFTIPSSSMSPGLLTGDYILVSKYAYGWSAASLPGGAPHGGDRLLQRQPERGDVVVFRLPRDPDQVWIKRVIGLPGDRVQMRDGAVVLNGRALPQSDLGPTRDLDAPARAVEARVETQPNGRRYSTYDGGRGLPGDDTDEITVPAGAYLVMGDNRDNSLDGRWPASVGVGLLPAANLVGRAERIAWSWKPGAALSKPWTWLNLRWNRLLVPIR